MNILLIGNKGVIHHESPAEQHRLMRTPIELSGGEELVDFLEAAIKTGTPPRIQAPIVSQVVHDLWCKSSNREFRTVGGAS